MEQQKPGQAPPPAAKKAPAQLAARAGDKNAHGGEIKSGDHETRISGQPAAREGDLVSCPKHGPGRVEQVSKTVKIGGALAARRADCCACEEEPKSAEDRPGTAGPGTSTKVLYSTDPLQRTEKEQFEHSHVRGPLAQSTVGPDGTKLDASALKINFGSEEDGANASGDLYGLHLSQSPNGLNVNDEAYAAQVKGSGSFDVGDGAATVNADGSASILHGEVKGGAGPTGDDEGYSVRKDAGFCLAHAEGTVSVESNLGDAVSDYYGQFGQAAASSGALGFITQAQDLSKYLDIGVGVNGSLCGGGVDGGFAAYAVANKDREKFGLEAEFLAKLEVWLTFGHDKPKKPKHADNKVVSGSPTVKIGG